MADFQLLSTTRYDPFLKTLKWNNANDGADPSAFFLLSMHHARLVEAAHRHGWVDKEGYCVPDATTEEGKESGHQHVKEWLKYDVLKAACMDAVWERTSGLDEDEREWAPLRVRITVSRKGQISVTPTFLNMPFIFDPTCASLFKPASSSMTPEKILIRDDTISAEKPSLPDTRPLVKIYIDSEPTTRSLFTETKTTVRDAYDAAKARVASRVDEGVAAADWDVLLYTTEEKIMETSIFNVAFFRDGKWVTPSAAQTGCLPGVMRRYLLETGRIEEEHGGVLSKSSIAANEWVLLFNGVQGCRLGRICA